MRPCAKSDSKARNRALISIDDSFLAPSEALSVRLLDLTGVTPLLPAAPLPGRIRPALATPLPPAHLSRSSARRLSRNGAPRVAFRLKRPRFFSLKDKLLSPIAAELRDELADYYWLLQFLYSLLKSYQ
jgi:hypothetical protein